MLSSFRFKLCVNLIFERLINTIILNDGCFPLWYTTEYSRLSHLSVLYYHFIVIIIYYIYTFFVPVFANYTNHDVDVDFCVSAHHLWCLVSSYTSQDRTLLAALPLSLITGRTRLLVRDPLAHIS